jgi:hypothetical protein
MSLMGSGNSYSQPMSWTYPPCFTALNNVPYDDSRALPVGELVPAVEVRVAVSRFSQTWLGAADGRCGCWLRQQPRH